MNEQTTSQGTPITPLALLAQQIDGMLEDSIEQYENLRHAEPQSSRIDAYSIGRVLARFTLQRDELWRFEAQLRRWEEGELQGHQRSEVARLTGQMLKLYEVVDNILRLAAALEQGTKEQQLTKSDTQAGGSNNTPSTRRKRSL